MGVLASETIRPSNLHRRERCPGSLTAERAIPVVQGEQESGFAGKGNRIHDEIEEGLLHTEKRVQILIDSEEPDIVKACWDEANRCWELLTPAQQGRARVLVEKEVDLSIFGMANGTPDFAIVVPGTDTESGLVILRDWKSGQGWVPGARWNLQLLAYAAGLHKQYQINGSANIGVFQPMVRTYADTWTASMADLETVGEKIKWIVTVCETWDSPPVIPGGHCIYCRAQGRCEARIAVAAETKQLANPVEAIKALSPERRRALYMDLGKAIKMLENAKEEIDASILKGETFIDGFGIGEGKKGRFWACQDPISVLKAIAARKGIDQGLVSEAISVSAAEKLLGKKEVENLVGIKVGNPSVKMIKEKK